MTKLLTIFLFIGVNFPLAAKTSDYHLYIIKDKDSVTEVLRGFKVTGKLYGENQLEEKVLKLNRLTKESAKALEPGDVIIIPKKSKQFTLNEYQDEVSSIKSAMVKSIETEFLKKKKHNLSLGAGAFYQKISFDDLTITTEQNFLVYGNYKNNQLDRNEWAFTPAVSFGGIFQSQADFSNDEARNADFSPSYFLETDLELNYLNTNSSITPFFRYDSLNTIFKTDNDYRVDTKNLFLTGIKLKQYFESFKNTSYITLKYATGSSTENQFGIQAGFNYKKHYGLNLELNQTNLDLNESAVINTYILNFSYLL